MKVRVAVLTVLILCCLSAIGAASSMDTYLQGCLVASGTFSNAGASHSYCINTSVRVGGGFVGGRYTDPLTGGSNFARWHAEDIAADYGRPERVKSSLDGEVRGGGGFFSHFGESIGQGYQELFAYGNGLSVALDYESEFGSHQNYNIDGKHNIVANGTDSAPWVIYLYQQNGDASTLPSPPMCQSGTRHSQAGVPITATAWHEIFFGGDTRGVALNEAWAHFASRSQGTIYDSDGGGGPTGRPSWTATGEGWFMQSAYGSTYLDFNSLNVDDDPTNGSLWALGVIMEGGGSASLTAWFNNGFSFQNFRVKTNNGGI